MKKLTIIFLVFLFALISFTGCGEDEIINNNNNQCNVVLPDSGAFILSEGGFNPNSSSLYYYAIKHDSMYPNVFCPGNLGTAPDGILINGQNMYLTEQGNFGGNGKIYKLNLNGSVQSSQTAGINPYTLAISNNKIYVTNGPSSRVTVIDAGSLSQIKIINVGVYPQEILAVGNKIFVCNTSAFGGSADSTISVIDANSDSVIATITLRRDPSSLVLSNNGFIYAGCSENANIIYKIDPLTYSILDSIIVTGPVQGGFGRDLVVDNLSNDAYFINGTNDAIIKVDLVTKNLSTAVSFPGGSSIWGYNFDKINRKHYVLDALSYTVNGKLYVYDINWNLEKTRTTGEVPRRIVFRNQ